MQTYTYIGHTHVNLFNEKNGKYYINPGAVGCPENTNCAPYGVLDISKDKIEYNQYFEKYNVQRMIDSIIQSKIPGYEWILRLFYGIDI